MLPALVKRLGRGRFPAVILIHDGELGRDNEIFAENFRDEKVAIALERFLCLKADVKTIPDRAARESLAAKAPALFFFDPAGEPVYVLSGRRASSQAALSSLIGRLWKRSFTLSLQNYTKEKDDILDRLESIDRKREAVLAKAARAEGKSAKIAPLARDIEEIETMMRVVLAADRELAQSVTLREQYRDRSTPEPE